MLRKWICCLVGLMIVFVAVVALAQTEKVDTKGGGFTVPGHITIEKIKKTGMIYLELLTEEQYAIDDDDDKKHSDSETSVSKYTTELKILVGEQEMLEGKVAFTFTNIPAGTYAIEAYLDVNGNEDFDGGLFGAEPWGFYRPARPTFGDPKFDKVKFDVLQDLTDIEFEIK